jgi:hypothetical protein
MPDYEEHKSHPPSSSHGRLRRVSPEGSTAQQLDIPLERQLSIEDRVYRQITAILSYSFKKRRESVFNSEKKRRQRSAMAIRTGTQVIHE